ncbi:MAG: VWA domain-containing protein [Leptospiraceae bacterium]|nr:VWA domain-containing protein [Leptospiraceae bacterium]
MKTKYMHVALAVAAGILVATCGSSDGRRDATSSSSEYDYAPDREVKRFPRQTKPGVLVYKDASHEEEMRPGPADDAVIIHNTESYDRVYENEFLRPAQNPLSTFAADVDTASYSIVRRFLNRGQLPPPGAVRIEELVNYFNYQYAPPSDDKPFAVHTEASRSPWNEKHVLLKIGIKGKVIPTEDTGPRNLVFLLDVSGSMETPDKLPLLKKAMRMLTSQMNTKDRVAIVVYAGASGLVLPPTAGNNQAAIMAALERLQAGGSTNGGAGIQLAYQTARQNFHQEGVNRVVLATDGDFNVGTTNQSELVRLIEKERESGIFLTVLGFGSGNYKDSTMEKLADKGNGNYAYIDTIAEARKVLVQQIGATLVTIAKDVKLQVEFNPAQVQSYRLIGYENRMLKAEDFNDDKKDAGEIGAGHTVTALYEIVPSGVQSDLGGTIDPLRYQQNNQLSGAASNGELATVKIRYKDPAGSTSKLLQVPVQQTVLELKDCSADMRMASAAAAYGMLLRGSSHKGQADYRLVRDLARSALQNDPHGYRAEFLRLAEMAGDLQQ